MSVQSGSVVEIKVTHIPSKAVIFKDTVIIESTTPTSTLSPPNSSYLVLNQNTTTWYRTIGEAVKAAQDNHTILVYPGYNVSEDVTVDKKLKIKALGKAVIDGVVTVKAENVEINGFEVYGQIKVYEDGCAVINNRIDASGYYQGNTSKRRIR